jgi:hypothetical protein
MPQNPISSMALMNGNQVAIDADGCIVNYAFKRKVVAKAAAYTCTRGDSGTLFTNQGTAANITFTLPAVATSAGCEYWFFHDGTTYTLTVAAPATTMVAFNNIACASVALSTASKMIGNCIHVYCDGTKWYSSLELGMVVAGGTILTVA